MTGLALLAGTAGLVSLPALTYTTVLRRLRPSEAAHLSAAALAIGSLAFEVGLLICAAPTFLGLVGAGSARVSQPGAIHHFFPGGSVAGWLALLGAVSLPLIAGRGAIRVHQTRRQFFTNDPAPTVFRWNGWNVVVIDSNVTVAVALPTPRPRIIVSSRVVLELDREQFVALLHHEAAHLRHHHSRYLMLATVLRPILGRIPIARTSLDAFELSIEKWADEAAGTTPNRRAAVRDALITLARVHAYDGIAAFSNARGVMERVQALEGPVVHTGAAIHLLPYAALMGLTLLALGSFVVFFFS